VSPRRTALVTGAAQGIGRACVDALQASGLRVIGVDIKDQDQRGLDAVIRADLSDADVCHEVIEAAGAVDVLVNNAAVLVEKPIDVFSVPEFDHTVAVNLRAPFLLAQGLVRSMAEREWGRLINVASIGARTGGISDSAVYAATKAGLVSLTRSFARHYGGAGITANAVAPGAIATPMAVDQFDRSPELHDRVVSQIPVGRLGTGAEVADVVNFLAGDAAAFVNGVTIDVNGGWVMA